MLPGSENADEKSSVVFVQEGVRVAAVAQQVEQALEGNRVEFANYHLKQKSLKLESETKNYKMKIVENIS